MSTALFVLLWWLALFGWWVVLVGTNAGSELIAAGCAALVAALLAAGVRRQRLLRFRFEARWLAKTLKVPWNILRELGVVVRHVSSRYRALAFPTGGQDATSAGRRAVASVADAVSPNAFPVDMDRERKAVLHHELDPRHASNDVP